MGTEPIRQQPIPQSPPLQGGEERNGRRERLGALFTFPAPTEFRLLAACESVCDVEDGLGELRGSYVDQYARKECARCHVILPANEMFPRSGTVVSGRSESTSQKVGTLDHQYYSPVNTTTTHYRATSYWLCWPCEQQRRKAVRSVILAVFVVSAVLIGVAAVGSVFGDRPPHPATVLPSRDATLEVASNAELSESKAADPGPEPAPPSAVATQDSADQAATDAETLMSQLPTLLDSDIRKAVQKNETRLWHKNGMRGYVVVSGDSAAPSAVCKNVIITMMTAQEQRQTAPQKWCHSSNQDEWYPA